MPELAYSIKVNLDPRLTPRAKTNWRWIKGLNVTGRTVKLCQIAQQNVVGGGEDVFNKIQEITLGLQESPDSLPQPLFQVR